MFAVMSFFLNKKDINFSAITIFLVCSYKQKVNRLLFYLLLRKARGILLTYFQPEPARASPAATVVCRLVTGPDFRRPQR